ncbi:MAG: PAS domain S-box protein [Azonexaceae bacterium]|nr:PAS domain S-box protein [Azonexaceae bacterium]
MMLLVMPVFTWLSLSRSPSPKLKLWCASGILVGAGTILFGLRPHVPAWVGYPLTNFLIVLGSLVRIQSLRHEAAAPWPASWLALGAIVPILIFEFIRLVLDDVGMRVTYIYTVYMLLFGYVSIFAWQIGRKFQSRSAMVIAGFHGLLAAGFLLRLCEIAGGSFSPDMMGTTYGGILIAIAGLLAGAVSHMAYVGMQFELTREKLVTAEGEYQGILNTTPDGFILTDADGRFLDVNEIYCRMLGYAREDLLAMGVRDVKEADDPDTISEVFRRNRERGFSRYETRHRCRDGRLLDVEVSVTHMPEPENKFLVFIRDISERKLAQNELERRVLARTMELATARAEAESANAVKTRFMTNVSHEMGTPMQGILGFAEIGKIKTGDASPEKLRAYFEAIEQSGKRLHELIESLLHLAESAWAEYSVVANEKLRALSPSQLAIQSCAMMEQTAQQRQQKIVVENLSSLSVIRGDEALLHQVLEHLIGNALRYSPERTTVMVKLLDKPAQSHASKTSMIQVIDEGCGIPEKELGAIFEPFYESSRTATGAGGTGLGLALCKAIVKRHKGEITAANRPQGGAIFEVSLPAE